MENYILYQAYGGADFANECRYSLLKFLSAYNLVPPAHTSVVIYTDRAEMFSEFIPFFPSLHCLHLPAETVKRWRGEIDFVHRVKIEMMVDFFSKFDGNLLYCDTDTYIDAPVDELFRRIADGEFLMHQFEGVIDQSKYPSFHKWENFLRSNNIDYNNKSLQFSPQLKMYNAGVIGLSSMDKNILQDVLALTDAIYRQFPKHIAEQFAFSYCLQKAGELFTTDHLISHYWNLKEFRTLLHHFFYRNIEESIPNQVKKVQHLDALQIMDQKIAFKKLPFLKRVYKNLNGSAWRIGSYEKKL